jgi:hypothetical protein
MPAGLTKGLELKNSQSVYCDEETGKKYNLSGVRRAAVVNADPAVAPDIATLILMGSMRKF